MAGLPVPLPTLRPWPRGQTRTARGRRGSLLLRRIGLSPTTPGRSPGALPRPGDQNLLPARPSVPLLEAAEPASLALVQNCRLGLGPRHGGAYRAIPSFVG